jgi:hypothetical protein
MYQPTSGTLFKGDDYTWGLFTVLGLYVKRCFKKQMPE